MTAANQPSPLAEIVTYAAQAGESADERYLLEAIPGITTDPTIVRLIETWFDMADTEDNEERATMAASFLQEFDR